MMINDRIHLTVEQHVAHVCLARPEKMNALDAKMMEAIQTVGDQLRTDSSVRVVVLSGEGDNFCAGLDKSNFAAMVDGKTADSDKELPTKLAERTHGIANQVQHMAWMWRELPMPVISALNGFVLGGGLQIALGADFRYASSNSQYSILELKWGIVPDMSSTQIMRHMVRDDVIRELTYTARVFSAQQALEWGFITHIVDDPLAQAMQVANVIAGQNPQAVRACKKIIDSANYQTAAEGLLMESIEQDKIIGTPNQVEAVMANLQKRAAVYKD